MPATATMPLEPALMSDEEYPINPSAAMTPGLRTSYTLKLTADDNGKPLVGFEDVAVEAGEGALDINIFRNSVVTFKLDTNNCDWEFRHDNGIMVGTVDAQNRYHNLTPIPPYPTANQRCTSVSFEATYDADNGDPDPYTLHFVIYQMPNSAPYNQPMTWKVDPDIKNPGDDGLVGGIGP